MVAVVKGKEQLSPAVYIPLGLVSWKILSLPDSQISSGHVYHQARPRGLFRRRSRHEGPAREED
jgi:hypothetical protein